MAARRRWQASRHTSWFFGHGCPSAPVSRNTQQGQGRPRHVHYLTYMASLCVVFRCDSNRLPFLGLAGYDDVGRHDHTMIACALLRLIIAYPVLVLVLAVKTKKDELIAALILYLPFM